MERRNFLKGIFGAYALGSGYFSFKYFKNKNKLKNVENQNDALLNKTNLKKKAMGVIVEIPIVYHCNLNCAYCDHFAPIAPKYIMPVEVFKKDIERMAKITKGDIKELWILGGEPLLHNNIEEIFKLARKNFPKTKIEMLTNGLLLDKQKDSFWISCYENKIKIVVENYIYNEKEKINFDLIEEKLKKYHCNLSVDGPKYRFRQMDLTKEKVHISEQRYNKCECKLWPILDNGKFYPCSTINGVEKFFNKKFPNNAIAIDENDILDIHKINSIKEIIDFYNKPKSLCAHCNYFLSEGKKWKTSNLEANEWYKG